MEELILVENWADKMRRPAGLSLTVLPSPAPPVASYEQAMLALSKRLRRRHSPPGEGFAKYEIIFDPSIISLSRVPPVR